MVHGQPAPNPEESAPASDDPAISKAPPQPLRNREKSLLRFSLRSLFAATILVGAAVGYFGWKWAATQRELGITASLKERGAEVFLWKGHVSRISIRGDQGKPLDGAALIRLAKLPQLKTLILLDVRLAADAIPAIGRLSTLEELAMLDAELEDVRLEPLSQLANLQTLSITNAGLTDESLTPLVSLEQLRYLNLNDNRFSEGGVLQLQPLIELKQLSLANTGLGDQAYEKLKQALINTQIVREPVPTFQPE